MNTCQLIQLYRRVRTDRNKHYSELNRRAVAEMMTKEDAQGYAKSQLMLRALRMSAKIENRYYLEQMRCFKDDIRELQAMGKKQESRKYNKRASYSLKKSDKLNLLYNSKYT